MFMNGRKLRGGHQYDKAIIGIGEFHRWGIDYEELESGPAHFSTAIIEMPDGSVKNVPVELIVFHGV